MLSCKQGRGDSETHCTGRFISPRVCCHRSALSLAAASSFFDHSKFEALPITPNNAFDKPLSVFCRADCRRGDWRRVQRGCVCHGCIVRTACHLAGRTTFHGLSGLSHRGLTARGHVWKKWQSDYYWLIVPAKHFDIRPGSCLVETEKFHFDVIRRDADSTPGPERAAVSQTVASRSGSVWRDISAT